MKNGLINDQMILFISSRFDSKRHWLFNYHHRSSLFTSLCFIFITSKSFCSVCDTQKEILHFIEAYGENYCWAPVRHVMLWWHGLAQGSLYECKTSMDQKFSVKRVIIQLHRRFCHNEGKMISELRATEENSSDAEWRRCIQVTHCTSTVLRRPFWFRFTKTSPVNAVKGSTNKPDASLLHQNENYCSQTFLQRMWRDALR